MFWRLGWFPFFLFLILFSFPVQAVDRGVPTNADKPQKVEVVNEEAIGVEETKISDVIPIASEIQIKFGEDYTSSFMDVQHFKEITFYVLANDETVFTDSPSIMRYQLDAFFSVTSQDAKLYAMGGGTEPEIKDYGRQEFGEMHVKEEGGEMQGVFTKLTTGETSTRALHCKIYGPYVRVVLKNLTPDKAKKFSLLAYVTK